MESVIKVKQVMGHYEIYVHNVFYRSCDAGELSETIREIEEELKDGEIE